MSWRACLGNSAQFECLPPPATTLAEDAGGIRMPASSTTNIQGGTMTASSRHTETAMRTLFVGGTVENSELDSDGNEPRMPYPPIIGSAPPRTGPHKSRERREGDERERTRRQRGRTHN